jgi:hypothetical protein
MRLGKKLVGCLITIGVMGALTMNTFANTDVDSLSKKAKSIETETEYDDETASYTTNINRGELISNVEIGIEKVGIGIARISGEIDCHRAMSEITIVLQLQKYDEEHKTWQMVNRQTFEWKASDLPEGEDLCTAYIAYNIAGLESGDYRVRAIFDAVDLDDNLNEAWSVFSAGIEF